jgi:ParB family chromosome partitioning protein
MGHARALLVLEPAQQILSANEIVSKKLSVRDAEKLVARGGVSGRQSPLLRVKKEKPGDVARLEERLADHLAAAVEIRLLKKTRRGESGEVAISFGSYDELSGLLERLGLGEDA